MKPKCPFFQFPAAISRDSPSHHFDGYAMLCSPFAELVASFLQHQTVSLWTTKTPKLPTAKIHTTIGLRVSFLFACEIAVHSVSTSPGPCAFVDYEGLNDRTSTTEGTTRRQVFRDDVIRRDGPACVVTQVGADDCVAAHLIPHSKGDGVRSVVSSYNHLTTLFSSTFKE
jgi:hypothetical protein